MLVFGVRIEVASSLWWQESGLGLAFGPGGPEGPEGPWGWMLVFCVRIEVVVVLREVMGGLWWQERGLGLG